MNSIKKTKFFKITLSVIFISIFIFGFIELNNLLLRKSVTKPWDMGNKIGGFYNESEKYDMMFFGTSHSYCSFIPLYLYNDLGLKSYVLASQKQPLKISYRYIKDAVKHTKPKIIFVDIQAAIYKLDEDSATVHSYCDYMPMSMNKLKMIAKDIPTEHKLEALLPIISYHSRWSELKSEDFTVNSDKYEDDLKGYVMLKGQSKSFLNGDDEQQKDLEKIKRALEKSYLNSNLKTISKIIDLAAKNDIKVIFVKTPVFYYDDYKDNIDIISKYIEKKNIDFIDFNLYSEDMNLTKNDFYDPYHLNVAGAEKFNKFFINYMFDKGIYKDNSNLDEAWRERLEKYNINKE